MTLLLLSDQRSSVASGQLWSRIILQQLPDDDDTSVGILPHNPECHEDIAGDIVDGSQKVSRVDVDGQSLLIQQAPNHHSLPKSTPFGTSLEFFGRRNI